MFELNKKTIVQALVIGGAVTLAAGFVADKGIVIRMAAGVVAAFLAVPMAVQVAAG